METGLSIVGVLLITNPLASDTTVPVVGNLEDHIPGNALSKVIGLCFAFPSIISIGVESRSIYLIPVTAYAHAHGISPHYENPG